MISLRRAIFTHKDITLTVLDCGYGPRFSVLDGHNAKYVLESQELDKLLNDVKNETDRFSAFVTNILDRGYALKQVNSSLEESVINGGVLVEQWPE